MEKNSSGRRLFWRRAGTICIAAGICLAMFPFLKEKYEDTKQREMLREWNTAFASMDQEKELPPEEKGAGMAGQEESRDGVEGVLKIPAIDLEQPVLKGASEENLAVSLASIEPTGKPGGPGNFAIAGHNSRTYGRHFNRLNEVAKGDEIFFETPDESITYQVTGSFVVEADEIWVLEDTIEGPEITLVTCFYPKDGETQRLVVKGMQKVQ